MNRQYRVSPKKFKNSPYQHQRETRPLWTVLKLKKQLSQRWFVYVLRCADDSLYTGITIDLSRRITQHNAGTASRYTRSRLPVVLEYQEEVTTKGSALKRELAIKALSRKAKEILVRSGR